MSAPREVVEMEMLVMVEEVVSRRSVPRYTSRLGSHCQQEQSESGRAGETRRRRWRRSRRLQGTGPDIRTDWGRRTKGANLYGGNLPGYRAGSDMTPIMCQSCHTFYR